MLRILLLIAATLVCLEVGVSAKERSWNCLPNDIKATDVVSTQVVRAAAGGREIRKTTVARKLTEIKARCSNGKLIDSSRTEIRFFKLTGCWGTRSDDDREVLDRQARELADLKKRYRVIEMTCNPSGEQIP